MAAERGGPPIETRPVARRRRSDAEQNAGRILEATAELLRTEPAPTVEQVAGAAGVTRATVYRHFSSRRKLLDIARGHALSAPVTAGAREQTQPPSETAAGAETDDHGITALLARVPPHLIGEQIVAEARRLPGASSAALYVVDIDGSRLLRFAGSAEFPAELAAPLAVGPELPRAGIAIVQRMIEEELPGSVAAPLHLRGRTIGLLLAVGADQAALGLLAEQAAVAMYLADGYTDAIAVARRRRRTTPAGEIQQNLLPPRMMNVSGAAVAGNVLPSYDVGGDWFEYVENADGAWLAIADATGTGERAASLAALALGAFRAARRGGADLGAAVQAIHDAVVLVGEPTDVVTALIGRWHGPAATFTWIACGQPGPALITPDGELRVLDCPDGGALGGDGHTQDRRPSTVRLSVGDCLVLCSDGVTDRITADGTPFGFDGVREAVARTGHGSATGTIAAIEAAVLDASPDSPADDATLVALVPTRPSARTAPTGPTRPE